MKRSLLLAMALLICLPVAFQPVAARAQSKRAATDNGVPCCGQVATEESPEQMRMQTQQNLQALLLQASKGKKLAAGDYLISESPEGYEFRALVSRQGVVDAWYVADWDGTPVALINNNGGPGGTGPGTVSYCFTKYSRDISDCARLQGNWPNRYTLCINAAWDSLISCLAGLGGGTNGGVIMR